MFVKFTRKHLCQRFYFNKICRPKAVKKRFWHKCFPSNLGKFLRTPLFQEHPEYLRTTASAFIFSEAATGDVLWKKVFLKILQNLQEHTCGLRNFQEQLFYRTPLDDSFWLFPETLLKWGTANSVWKTSHCSDEYSLSTNSNLRSTAQVSFLSWQHKFSVYVFTGLHCLLPEAATRVEVFLKIS